MAAYVLKRCLLCIPTFIGITLVTFVVISLAPGDPASSGVAAVSDSPITPQVYQQLRVRYHLDEPVVKRYLYWLTDLISLDLGRSFADSRPVTTRIAERLPATVGLVGLALAFSLIVSIPLGVEAAMRAGSWFDRLVSSACYGLYAIPRYVMAMILILVVGVQLGWLPFMGTSSDNFADLSTAGKLTDILKHIALIGLCFAYPLIAYQTRFIRDNVAQTLRKDFITTARAKGVSEFQVAYRHALGNTMLPLLTLVGLMLPAMLGGSVILEVMFSWPGMGRLMFEAIMQRDYPVVMGLAAASATLVLVGTLIVDLLYVVVDPRVRCP